MNTETKAGHDSLSAPQQGTAEYQKHDYASGKDKLLADLKVTVADAEQLIKEAADCPAEGYATMRAKFDTKLLEAKAKLGQARTAVREKTKYATDATHAYIKENPWKSVGFAAVAGAVLGFLLRRR